MTNPESPSNGDQNVEKITYIGEVLNNIGTFTLSVWLPLELVDLCDALASNLDIVIDDGLKKPPKGSRNVTKWSSELFVSPRELRLSFRPPEEGPVSSSQKTPSLDMPLPRVIDVRSAKITVTDNILDAKFTLAAGPDTSNGWRREIRVPHRLTASQVEHTTGISCASCGKSVLKKKYRPAGAEEKEEDYFYRSVDLPSEHWYELVECWMCHQEDYGRNGRFEKSTQAAPGSLAVGASYVLLSGDDLDKAAIRVESASKQDDDDQKKPSPFEPSMVTCLSCSSPLGEAFYDAPSKEDFPTTFRVPLYYLSFDGTKDNSGHGLKFVDFFVSDLLEDARTHGSYRILIDEKRPKQKVVVGAASGSEYEASRLLIWLLAWDLQVVTNVEDQGGSSTTQNYRAIKLLYQTLPELDGNPMAKAWLAAPEKLDRLRYDRGAIGELVDELERANRKLPETKRKLHGFHVAILRHG